MLAILASQLIKADAAWTPSAVKSYAEDLGKRFADNLLVRGFSVAHGDSFRFEVARHHALRVALLAGAMARRGGRPGLRTAVAFQEDDDADVPITLRSGVGYRAAAAGLVQLVRSKETLTLVGESQPGWREAVALAGHTLAGFSPRQAETLGWKLHDVALDQNQLAVLLGVSQQAISKHFRGGTMKALLRAVDAFASEHAPPPGSQAAKRVAAYRNPYES